LQFDGHALNESRALAYEEKIAPRKKVEKKLPQSSPRKPTLLELAMMKKCSTSDRPAPTVEVLLKQKKLAHDIAAKSQVGFLILCCFVLMRTTCTRGNFRFT